ncbi:MAG: HTH domain-containing protein [Spirochaetales bacterium]|nr:HTH domain-containing protein [Spirochaetales bacterium]
MKDRQKKMLRFLLNAEENIRIDDIAAAFKIGSRTVSRDLDFLENWLSLRGVFLERKTNKGIRILTYGKDPAEILEIINTPESYFSDLAHEQRQSFIFLYLLYNSREIKIAEVASTFFVSDTCVWNDLQQLEPQILKSGLALSRQKGVGVRIDGDEISIRLAFIRVFSRIFSTKSIIPYLYCVKEKQSPGIEVNKLNLLLENLKITGDHNFLFNLITFAEELLDNKFTLSGESFIYFYLLLTAQRMKAGFMINTPLSSECFDRYRDAGDFVIKKLTEKSVCGQIPRGEVELLGLIFQISELGDINLDNYEQLEQYIPESVITLSQKMISKAGEIGNEYFYLDPILEKILNASLASLVLRMANRIPHWWDERSAVVVPGGERSELEETIATLIKNELDIEVDEEELRAILFHFKASSVNPHHFSKEKIRCIICCFEGIGLVSYLYSIVSHDLPELDIVEATAVYKFDQRYLDMNRIDLVISTFPISDIETPVVVVPLPVERVGLEKLIQSRILRIKKEDSRYIKLPEILSEKVSSFSIDHVLSFIQEFKVKVWDQPYDLKLLIGTIARETGGDRHRIKKIEKAIWMREEHGPLILPEFGIRIFHCKSSGVDTPKSGLIRLDKGVCGDVDEELIVYIVAPDPCPENTRLMLSAFTVGIMERPLLRKVLSFSSEEKVRLGLYDLYHSLL